jgi:hypothetical protein
MDKPKVTPKDFFLWAGAMVALYWSVIAFIFLVFNYIDYSFPNALSYLAPNPYDSGVGSEMASIVVLFPVYVILMWMIRSDSHRDRSRLEIWIRRWALILTLFVAGATIAGDLISLLATFFTGNELTAAFLLKSLILILVAAGAFMHFIADYWGYWEQHEGRKRTVCTAVGVLAAVAVIAGFILFGTPAQARQYRYDEQRVTDLQSIQSQVVNYWQSKETLPASLGDLNDTISGFTAPVDPQTDAPYTYKKTGTLSFQLCAVFSAASRSSEERAMYAQPAPAGVAGKALSDTWTHAAGDACFDRTIDPQFYPPFSKTR